MEKKQQFSTAQYSYYSGHAISADSDPVRLTHRYVPLALGAILCLAGGASPALAQQWNLNSDENKSGPSFVWEGAQVRIGNIADATLTLTDGAKVFARASNASAIQLGNGVGVYGGLNISGLGTQVSTGRLGVGATQRASGAVTVTDNGLLQADTLNVAFYAPNTGTVTVNSGGRIESNNATIGYSGVGSLTIVDPGSSFDVHGTLWIGREASGHGTLDIGNGATVSAGALSLGLGPTATGQASVKGAGSSLAVVGELRLGRLQGGGSASTLNISDHGAVSAGFVRFGDGSGTIDLGTDGVLAAGHIYQDDEAIGGTNAFNFSGGTLRLTGDQPELFKNLPSGSVTLGGNGGTIDTQGYDVSVVSDIRGGGALTKTGAGTLRLMATTGYTGNTDVQGGALAAGAANVFAPGSNHIVQRSGVLSAGDFDQTVGALENSGRVSLSGGTAANVLTIAGNYHGNGGVVEIDTVLGDDASATDRLVIGGNSTGSSFLRVNNAGGAGALTNNGIKVIDVAGNSAGTFKLQGDYVHQGEQTLVADAYAYKLYQGGTATPDDGNWYLRSELIAPTSSEPRTQALYQAGVPVYEAYPQTLLALNALPTLQQRIGNRFWAGNDQGGAAQGEAGTKQATVWGRIEGSHSAIKPNVSTSGSKYDQDIFRLQTGVDARLADNADGQLIGGLSVRYGRGSTSLHSVHGDGSIRTEGVGLDGTLTWYGDNGFYADAQGQASWYSSDLKSRTAGINLDKGNDGFGYAFSLEAGKRLNLDKRWSLTPQAQLAYSNVDFDRFTDPFGASVRLKQAESLEGRLGLALGYENAMYNGKRQPDRILVYGAVNLYQEFLDGTSIDVSGTRFDRRNDRTRGGLGVGGTYSWNDGKYSIYGEVNVTSSLSHFGDSYGIQGQAGIRLRW